jgi:hypothetical protein
LQIWQCFLRLTLRGGFPGRSLRSTDTRRTPTLNDYLDQEDTFGAILSQGFAVDPNGRVVGWVMSSRMKRNLAIQALDKAVAFRQPAKDCVHHTDRRSQYCSYEYQKRLSQHGFKVSMTG